MHGVEQLSMVKQGKNYQLPEARPLQSQIFCITVRSIRLQSVKTAAGVVERLLLGQSAIGGAKRAGSFAYIACEGGARHPWPAPLTMCTPLQISSCPGPRGKDDGSGMRMIDAERPFVQRIAGQSDVGDGRAPPAPQLGRRDHISAASRTRARSQD